MLLPARACFVINLVSGILAPNIFIEFGREKIFCTYFKLL